MAEPTGSHATGGTKAGGPGRFPVVDRDVRVHDHVGTLSDPVPLAADVSDLARDLGSRAERPALVGWERRSGAPSRGTCSARGQLAAARCLTPDRTGHVTVPLCVNGA